YNAGSNGTATITGGTWSNSSSITVGQSGTGTLNINGGAVTTVDAYVGYNAGSKGTLTITSGTWNNTGLYFYVGYSGTGTLNVNGGSVTNSYAYLGRNFGSA